MKRPFDLNKAIETWRSKLTDAEALRASDIAELETHLRDGFAELRDGGLSEDESFLIARRRLGGEELVEEFAKVNPNAVWAERGKWMLLGVLGFEVFWSALNIVCALVQMVVVRFVVGPAGSIWNQALTTGATLILFAYVVTRLVRGKWRLGGFGRLVALRHPAVLAVCVGLMFLAEKALQSIQMIVATASLDGYGFRNMLVTSGYLNYGLAFATLILLALASAIAHRRTARAK